MFSLILASHVSLVRDNYNYEIVFILERIEILMSSKKMFSSRWFTISTDGWQKNCTLATTGTQNVEATTRG